MPDSMLGIADHQAVLLKYELEDATCMQNQLSALGVTRESLFPDLDHLAKGIMGTPNNPVSKEDVQAIAEKSRLDRARTGN